MYPSLYTYPGAGTYPGAITYAQTLPEASFELDGYPFGGVGATVAIEDVDFGAPGIFTHDTARPRADGIMFGRDWRGGRIITFTLSVLTEYTAPAVATVGGYGTVSALDALAGLERAFLADQVRTTPGAVSTLRYRLGGRQRVVYGRGRKFAAISRWATLGRIPVTCEFQCVDHLFYDDTQYTNLVDYVPPPAGGLTWPITFPWSTITVGYSPGTVGIYGNTATWLPIVIHGPIASPTVRYVNGWTVGLDLTLRADQWVTIDPRPWSRSVRLNDGTNVAGALTADSPRLSDIRIMPGLAEIVLAGADSTGTSSMTLLWRAAYTSP